MILFSDHVLHHLSLKSHWKSTLWRDNICRFTLLSPGIQKRRRWECWSLQNQIDLVLLRFHTSSGWFGQLVLALSQEGWTEPGRGHVEFRKETNSKAHPQTVFLIHSSICLSCVDISFTHPVLKALWSSGISHRFYGIYRILFTLCSLPPAICFQNTQPISLVISASHSRFSINTWQICEKYKLTISDVVMGRCWAIHRVGPILLLV